MEVYNKNRDNNRNMRDEIREQNAKLKGAPLKEKWEYFKEYYLKITLAVIACAVFVIYVVYTIATAPSDTAFAAYFYNNTGDSSSTELLDGFVEYIGLDTSEHEAYIDATMSYHADSIDYYDGYVGLEKSMAVITSRELDLIVGDEEAFDYYARSEVFADVTSVLPEDLLEQFSDRLYYYTSEETGETTAVGIDISDAPKLQEYHYYDDVQAWCGFLVNSDSLDNAVSFLRYIYLEE